MKLETFFEHFDLLTNAPNAAAKLRELVLQLAVQGKLVPQDPNDEPASVLLKKIDQEKGILTSSIQVKSDEQPFPLSPSWEWVYFERVLHRIHYGYTASADFSIKDVRLLRITDIQDNKVNWSSVPGCQVNEDDLRKYVLNKGDLLIARTGGTIGKSYLIESLNVTAVFASYLIRAIPCEQVFPGYLKLFLESHLYWEQLYQKSMGTGQPNVNATSLKSLVVPIPPLAEQKRIVAKVDTLLALCDAIGKQQQQRQQNLLSMNDTALAQLLTAPTPDDFQHHWHGLCDNFDLLYSVPETIPKLRQAILQLAVQGKLLPQDPNDESVNTLLEATQIRRSKLIENGKIGKFKLNHPISSNGVPYQIPDSWQWVRFGNLVESMNNGLYKPTTFFSDNGVACVRMFNIQDGSLDLNRIKRITVSEAELNTYKLEIGDLLVNRVNSRELVGRAALVRDIREPLIYEAMNIRVRLLHTQDLPEYINLLFRTDRIRETFQGDAKQASGQASVSQPQVANILVPLPPLAEQKRIVAKVDALLALCDTLETKLNAARNSSATLMDIAARQILVAQES
jgi:type I restriction enzyme S subunit